MLILVVVIAAGWGIYQFLQQEPPKPVFVDEAVFSAMLSDTNISAAELNEVSSSFSLGLSDEAKQLLKGKLAAISAESASSREFKGLLQGLIALDEDQGQIADDFDSMLDLEMGDFCVNIDYWAAKEEFSSDLVVKAIELQAEMGDFYASNPGYASLGIEINTENLAEEQELSVDALNRLVDLCIIDAYLFEEETELPEAYE